MANSRAIEDHGMIPLWRGNKEPFFAAVMCLNIFGLALFLTVERLEVDIGFSSWLLIHI